MFNFKRNEPDSLFSSKELKKAINLYFRSIAVCKNAVNDIMDDSIFENSNSE